MVLPISYMANSFQTLFIFGIQQLNPQVTEEEKETMLKNGMIFPMLLKMPILFPIR
jgi:hypothetical protein